ncbi:MAG TPA: PEP-CTERM sorting domain-containing protein [Gemmataceae bacterium]|nr:PEP-CTERM sorting domain-containing protein [Gemmataceae bacterium]
MFLVRIWRWSALAVAFGLFGSAARAEMITPNSIPNPPSAVGFANGSPVPNNNIVVSQYNGLGLDMAGTAITSLNNTSMWVPLGISAGPTGSIDYAMPVSGTLVAPGSVTPTTVSSLTLETYGLSGNPILQVSGLNGQSLNIVPVLQSGVQPFGFQEWTVAGTGISSFSISAPNNQNGPWGVSGVSFTAPNAATAPEPSSIVLAGLGAIGLAARWRWRRLRAVVA